MFLKESWALYSFLKLFQRCGFGESTVFGAMRNLLYKPMGQETEALALRNADTGNVLH